MKKVEILFKSQEEIVAKHLPSNEWIMYIGTLTVFERSEKRVVLKIKSEIYDSFISMVMDDEKTFSGRSISDVYAKLVKWFSQRDVKF